MTNSGAFAKIEPVLAGYCKPNTARYPRTRDRSVADTHALIQRAVDDAHHEKRSAKAIETACTERNAQLIRHLSVSEVVHDHNVQELLIGVMFNSMRPSLKESAAFALASARNYEWMTPEWLRLNRQFISSAGHWWKSIVLVECEMKISGHSKELHRFRDATLEFRQQEASRTKIRRPAQIQLKLPSTALEEPHQASPSDSRESKRTGAVLVERLDTFIAAAE